MIQSPCGLTARMNESRICPSGLACPAWTDPWRRQCRPAAERMTRQSPGPPPALRCVECPAAPKPCGAIRTAPMAALPSTAHGAGKRQRLIARQGLRRNQRKDGKLRLLRPGSGAAPALPPTPGRLLRRCPGSGGVSATRAEGEMWISLAKAGAGRAAISAERTESRTKSCTKLCWRKRTSVLEGCTLTSTSVQGISRNSSTTGIDRRRNDVAVCLQDARASPPCRESAAR